MPYSLKDLGKEIDFSLMGISTDFPDYQLAYWLNKKLNMQLKKEPKGLDVKNNKSNTMFIYAFFSYFDRRFESETSLIGNRSYKNYDMQDKRYFFFVPRISFFIDEKKQFDYFLHLKGFSQKAIQCIESEIRQIQGVFFVECVKNKSLKPRTKANLIF